MSQVSFGKEADERAAKSIKVHGASGRAAQLPDHELNDWDDPIRGGFVLGEVRHRNRLSSVDGVCLQSFSLGSASGSALRKNQAASRRSMRTKSPNSWLR